MKDNTIDVEVVPVEVVRCPRCGSRNRLLKQERHVAYRCGGCFAPLENPFLKVSILKRCFQGVARRRSSRILGQCIAAFVVAILAVAVLQHHDQQPTPGLEASLPRLSKTAVINTPSPSPPLFARNPLSPHLETPAPPPKSLENGTILTDTMDAGHGRFTVDNGTDRDAVVKLVDHTKSYAVLAVYVQARSTATLEEIPEGIFTALCGQGVDWDDNAKFFKRKKVFWKFEPDLDFSMKLEQTGRQITRTYQSITLELAPSMVGANITRSDISAESFLEY